MPNCRLACHAKHSSAGNVRTVLLRQGCAGHASHGTAFVRSMVVLPGRRSKILPAAGRPFRGCWVPRGADAPLGTHCIAAFLPSRILRSRFRLRATLRRTSRGMRSSLTGPFRPHLTGFDLVSTYLIWYRSYTFVSVGLNHEHRCECRPLAFCAGSRSLSRSHEALRWTRGCGPAMPRRSPGGRRRAKQP